MRRSDAQKLGMRLAWRASLAAVACLVAACAGPGGPKPGKLELQDDGGFTITEQTRVPSGVRGDFEEALRRIEEGDLEGGIALLEEAAEQAPDATLVHVDLGIAYRLAEKPELAVKSLERAVELNPRHPMALNELGIAYRKVGRFDDARTAYQKALAVVPRFHFARRNLAILCDVYLGDLECALEHYERYAEMMPDDEQVPIWIADLRRRTGQ